MTSRLPPLRALQAFRAAALGQSFSKAARDLNVTPAAVSLQVKTLEDFLGVELFQRKPQSLVLTAAGRSYLDDITSAFELIETATRRVKPARARAMLSIAVPPAFSVGWLMPRLQSFRAFAPQVDVQITATARLVEPLADDYDAVIRWGRGGWPGLRADLLLIEHLVPVRSPVLGGFGGDGGFPTSLERSTALSSLSRPDDWGDWLCRFAPGATTHETLYFGDCGSVLQAAISGLGVALCDWHVVAADVAAGRLVAAETPLVRGVGHFLVYSESPTATVGLFRDWALDETSSDSATPPTQCRALDQ